MKLNYILTLIAEFPVLICLSWNIYKEGNDDALKVFLAILLLTHTVGSIVFMIENKDDLNQRLGNFIEQLYLEQSPINLEICKKMLLYVVHYIVIIICFVEISEDFILKLPDSFLRDQAKYIISGYSNNLIYSKNSVCFGSYLPYYYFCFNNCTRWFIFCYRNRERNIKMDFFGNGYNKLHISSIRY